MFAAEHPEASVIYPRLTEATAMAQNPAHHPTPGIPPRPSTGNATNVRRSDHSNTTIPRACVHQRMKNHPYPVPKLLAGEYPFNSSWVWITKFKSTLKSVLIDQDFLTRLLIGLWQCCQPIRCQVWESLLTNTDFYIAIYKQLRPRIVMNKS